MHRVWSTLPIEGRDAVFASRGIQVHRDRIRQRKSDVGTCRAPVTSSLTLWLARVASRLTVAGLGTTNLVVLARMLEPEGRGHYFLFLSLVTVLTVVADLGLSQSATVYSGGNGVPTDGVHRLL